MSPSTHCAKPPDHPTLHQLPQEVQLLERSFDNQLFIGQPLTCNTSQKHRETLRIIPIAVIERVLI